MSPVTGESDTEASRLIVLHYGFMQSVPDGGSSPPDPPRKRLRRERRTRIATCRLSPSEWAAWQRKAERAGLPVSELLRRAMQRTRTWTAEDSAAARELARAVGRIGANLNQIARWANRHRRAGDALEVLAQLSAIEQALAALRPAPGESQEPEP